MMPSSGSPRGRRHNGLDASSYAVVGAVDPRVGEHLLDVLYLYGIAAYLQPVVNLGATLHAVSMSSTPTDHLWVDRSREAEAKSLVAAEAAEAGTEVGSSGAPEHRPPIVISAEEDAAWRDIIASFSAGPPPPSDHPVVPPWPVAEDADDTDGDTATEEDPGSLGPPPPTRGLFVRRRGAGDRLPGRHAHRDPAHREVFAPRIDDPAYDPDIDPADRFVPPPPPPIPRPSTGAVMSALLALVGLLILIWPALLGLSTDISATLGVFALVGGLAGMFWRLHDTRPEDDGPDDGAVV